MKWEFLDPEPGFHGELVGEFSEFCGEFSEFSPASSWSYLPLYLYVLSWICLFDAWKKSQNDVQHMFPNGGFHGDLQW